MSLDNRHQDKSGQIERKKNNTRVDTLREEYGERFARNFVGTCTSALSKSASDCPKMRR